MNSGIRGYLFLFLLLIQGPLLADTLSKEYQIKSAMLVNLMQFFDWGESTDPSTVICLFQPDPFGSFINELVDKKNAAGRQKPLQIKRIRSYADIATCHSLFVSQPPNLPPHLPAQLIVISDEYATVNGTHHINLYVEDDHVGFEVNIDNVRLSQVEVNPQLLRVARVVKNTTKKGND
jgi:hypothetical protein